ncbi:MAG: hypothetical protein ACO1N9_02135 [Flavobacterium sp.]
MKTNPDTTFTSGTISKYKALAHRRMMVWCANVFAAAEVFTGMAPQHEKLQIVYANIRV